MRALVTADASYVRESILNPGAKMVDGYQNIMPVFQGLVTEEGLQQLIEYVRSLGPTSGNTYRTQPGGSAGGDHAHSAGPRGPGPERKRAFQSRSTVGPR